MDHGEIPTQVNRPSETSSETLIALSLSLPWFRFTTLTFCVQLLLVLFTKGGGTNGNDPRFSF